MADGYIPKKITYIVDQRDKSKNKARAIPSSATSSVKTAVKNASRTAWGAKEAAPKPEVITLDNTPGDTYRIVKYQNSSASHYRKAFLVTNDEGWIFEIDQDDLADLIINGTIINGNITDEVVWAKANRREFLIRTQSKRFKELNKEETGSIGTTMVKSSTLEEGRFYQTPSGQKSLIYLGKKRYLKRNVTTQQIEIKQGRVFVEQGSWGNLKEKTDKILKYDLSIPVSSVTLTPINLSVRNNIGKLIAQQHKINVEQLVKKYREINKNYIDNNMFNSYTYWRQIGIETLCSVHEQPKLSNYMKDYYKKYSSAQQWQYYQVSNIDSF